MEPKHGGVKDEEGRKGRCEPQPDLLDLFLPSLPSSLENNFGMKGDLKVLTVATNVCATVWCARFFFQGLNTCSFYLV